LALMGTNLGQWRSRSFKQQLLMGLWRFVLHALPLLIYAALYAKGCRELNDLAMSICGLLLFIIPLCVGSLLPFLHSSFSRILSHTLRHNRRIPLENPVNGSYQEIDDYNDKFVTDGGHDENLALLPLLQDPNVGDIILMDGGQDSERTCRDITEVMKKAVVYLDCAFTYDTGKYWTDDNEEFHRNMTDFILGEKDVLTLNYEVRGDTQNRGRVFFLKARNEVMYSGGLLFKKRVKDTSGICCDCCANSCGRCCCSCGTFPNNSTANVFYSSLAFRTYREEGEELADRALQALWRTEKLITPRSMNVSAV